MKEISEGVEGSNRSMIDKPSTDVNNLVDEDVNLNHFEKISMATPMDEDTGSFGLMFDVSSIKSLVITNLQFYTDVTTMIRCFVFTTRGGSYKSRTSLDDWTLISDGIIQGMGKSEFTPVANFRPVFLRSGEVQGFYVTLTTSDLRYKKSPIAVGKIADYNSHLRTFVGIGVGNYPADELFYESQLWRGVIEYCNWEFSTAPPTTFTMKSTTPIDSKIPTTSPSDPSLTFENHITLQHITLYGSNLILMDSYGISKFTSSTSNFLTEVLSKQIPSIRIIDIHVTSQSLNSTNNSILNVFVEIHLEYKTIGLFHPDFLVQESIRAKNKIFMMELKETMVPSLQKLYDVKAVRVFKVYRNSVRVPTSDKKSSKKFAIISILIAVFTIFFFIIICSSAIFYRSQCALKLQEVEKAQVEETNKMCEDSLAIALAEKYCSLHSENMKAILMSQWTQLDH